MNKSDLSQTAVLEAAKGAPPVVVAIEANAHSWSGADLITLLTIIYLVLQILWLLWRWRKAVKADEVHEAEGGGE